MSCPLEPCGLNSTRRGSAYHADIRDTPPRLASGASRVPLITVLGNMSGYYTSQIRSSPIQCGSSRTQRTPNEQRRDSKPNNDNEDNSKARAPRQVSHSDLVNLLNQREKAEGSPSRPRAPNAKTSDMRTGILPVVRVHFLTIIIRLLQFQTIIPMLASYLKRILLILNCTTMTQ